MVVGLVGKDKLWAGMSLQIVMRQIKVDTTLLRCCNAILYHQKNTSDDTSPAWYCYNYLYPSFPCAG
ncbi:hypothetical protein KKE26_10975 [bacterium]|nr:hypothetical protein [bacterium]